MNAKAIEHPSVELLSLYSSGDLPLFLRCARGSMSSAAPLANSRLLSLRAAKTELLARRMAKF